MKYIYTITFFIYSFHILGQSDVVINEFMSDNESTLMDEDGEYPDWIELHNSSSSPINLQGYGISDDESVPFMFTFPSFIIQPGACKVILASSKNKLGSVYLHTNFKISSSGESLLLTDPSGNLLDLVSPTPLSGNISYGRTVDNGLMWERLNESSPNLTNSTSNGIVFSHESGFYQGTIHLDLTATNGHEIRYSTDCTNPNMGSNTVSSPLILNNLQAVPNVFSNINTSPYWVAPIDDNFKAHIIKAATFNLGVQTSNIYTKVIFIDSNLNNQFSDLDIVSIVTEPNNLFDQDTGIYVPGLHFTTSNTTWSGNYFQKGGLWERKANIQYFNTSGELQLNQEVGIRIHGGKGRNLPQKSFRIYTEGDDGAPKLNYPFFQHLGEEKRVFDKVILRNSMTCWNNSVIKDEVTSHICRDLNFEIQHSKPVVVFINGEYWGIQSIREHFDEKYINEKFNFPEDSVNIVAHGSGNRLPIDYGIIEGSNLGHIQLYDFLNNNDLDVQANYQYIENILDMSSIVDYYCAEIYFNNKDWPTNNNKLWNNGTFGKWRQMLYDIDGGWQYLGISYDQLSRALSSTGSAQNAPYATFLLRKLFESQDFEDRFIKRMACLMKNEFDADTVVNTINYMQSLYANGMQGHVDRWQRPSSYSSWMSGVNGMISFANGRKNYVIQHINNQFGIVFDPDDYDCTPIAYADIKVIPIEDQLRIYPNPSANQMVWVDFDYPESNLDYQIFNLSGQMIMNGTIQNHEQLQINFTPGIYLFTAILGDQRITKRIVTL